MEIFRKSLVIFLDSGIFLFKCRGINQMILLKAFFLNDLVACAGVAPEIVCVHVHLTYTDMNMCVCTCTHTSAA